MFGFFSEVSYVKLAWISRKGPQKGKAYHRPELVSAPAPVGLRIAPRPAAYFDEEGPHDGGID